MNKIYLHFDKTSIAVSGNDFGEYIFNTQVKDKISNDEINSIIFDSHIKLIGTSFIKGLFKDYLGKIEIDEFKKIFTFEENSELVENKIWESINY